MSGTETTLVESYYPNDSISLMSVIIRGKKCMQIKQTVRAYSAHCRERDLWSYAAVTSYANQLRSICLYNLALLVPSKCLWNACYMPDAGMSQPSLK